MYTQLIQISQPISKISGVTIKVILQGHRRYQEDTARSNSCNYVLFLLNINVDYDEEAQTCLSKLKERNQIAKTHACRTF